MASKTHNLLSNSELPKAEHISELPSAEQSVNISALSADQAADEAARIMRTRSLRDSYAKYLIWCFKQKLPEAEKRGWGWVTIEKAYPPSKKFGLPLHKSHETHWAGHNEYEPLPANTNGIPKVMLLQGVRPIIKDEHGRQIPDPKKLPDGLTSVDVMQEDIKKLGYKVKVLFIKGMVNIIVVWNHAAWESQEEKRTHAGNYGKYEKETAFQITYGEYKASRAKVVTPATIIEE